jgi:hypothetical protein
MVPIDFHSENWVENQVENLVIIQKPPNIGEYHIHVQVAIH